LEKSNVLKNCLDPAIILYTPAGEFRGRKEVMDYLQRHYLRFAPKVRFEMTPRDVRGFGDALWYSYDFTIESPTERAGGHGMAMCRRTGGQWRILNMHNSLLQTDTISKP
jgi:ketosteroid isomerase-like protein